MQFLGLGFLSFPAVLMAYCIEAKERQSLGVETQFRKDIESNWNFI
jgi:hypothetical protein